MPQPKEQIKNDLFELIIQDVYDKVAKSNWPDALAYLYSFLYQDMDFDDIQRVIINFENIIEFRARTRQPLQRKDVLVFATTASSIIQKYMITKTL